MIFSSDWVHIPVALPRCWCFSDYQERYKTINFYWLSVFNWRNLLATGIESRTKLDWTNRFDFLRDRPSTITSWIPDHFLILKVIFCGFNAQAHVVHIISVTLITQNVLIAFVKKTQRCVGVPEKGHVTQKELSLCKVVLLREVCHFERKITPKVSLNWRIDSVLIGFLVKINKAC